MNEQECPPWFYHGTPHKIHTSERPFLDPSLAGGHDEGEPQEGHVFATPDKLMASLYAFKDVDCIGIIMTDAESVVVYDGQAPDPNARGFVFEVPAEGFKQTTYNDGRPTGKWAMLESEMPQVTDNSGNAVPGLPVGEPVRELVMRDLVRAEHLRICVFTGDVDIDTYYDALDDAIRAGAVSEFIREVVEHGWLQDITDTFYDSQP